MVQFNLLPDVKLEYIKARRTKNLMTVISFVVGAVALTILIFALMYVHVVQRKSLSDLNSDIKEYSTQIKDVEDLDKILTVQNQLNTLSTLHDEKPAASRLLGYITQVTPEKAGLNRLTVDFVNSSLVIGGTAPSQDVVSTYTDTLKSTRYTTDKTNGAANAFSEVVLSSFSRDEKGASFTISLKFDPIIFKITDKPELVIPTGLVTNQSNLFKAEN